MVAVMASGSGSNFSALLACDVLAPHVKALVCNVPGAGAIARANAAGVPVRVVAHRDFSTRTSHEEAVLEALAALVASQPCHNRGEGSKGEPEGDSPLVALVLAGYMRILGPTFLEGFSQRFPHATLVNLHPAHLDEYRGARGYEHAVSFLYPRWGLSVHRVSAELDGGELLASAEIPVLPTDTPDTLHARARTVEHELLVRTVRGLLQVPTRKESRPHDHVV